MKCARAQRLELAEHGILNKRQLDSAVGWPLQKGQLETPSSGNRPGLEIVGEVIDELETVVRADKTAPRPGVSYVTGTCEKADWAKTAPITSPYGTQPASRVFLCRQAVFWSGLIR